MKTRDMSQWETGISRVISSHDTEDIEIRGHRLDNLVGKVSFAAMMCLMVRGSLPSLAEERVLDALLVASMEHGIAPPSMVARCFASYGTSIQAAIGGGVISFGDRMGGLGEQLAKLMVEKISAAKGDTADSTKPSLSDAELATLAEEIVRDAHHLKQRVPGYGIPLHNADPRAPAVLQVARDEKVAGLYCRFATAIEQALAATRGGRTVPMNLDGVGAAVILDLGFTWQSTRLFLITPRSVSMGVHYLEEQAQDSIWRHIPADRIDYSG